MAGLIKGGAIDVLVVCDVLAHVPYFVDVFEISSEFWTASISLLECEGGP